MLIIPSGIVDIFTSRNKNEFNRTDEFHLVLLGGKRDKVIKSYQVQKLRIIASAKDVEGKNVMQLPADSIIIANGADFRYYQSIATDMMIYAWLASDNNEVKVIKLKRSKDFLNFDLTSSYKTNEEPTHIYGFSGVVRRTDESYKLRFVTEEETGLMKHDIFGKRYGGTPQIFHIDMEQYDPVTETTKSVFGINEITLHENEELIIKPLPKLDCKKFDIKLNKATIRRKSVLDFDHMKIFYQNLKSCRVRIFNPDKKDWGKYDHVNNEI